MRLLSSRQSGPLKGWLLLYLVALFVITAHALWLVIASIIIYANPSIAGLTSFVPLWSLLLYVITNLIVIVYAIVIYLLMRKQKKAAIAHNIVYNVVWVVFLVTWHFLGMKSPVGTVVDSVPNIIMLIYMVTSQRVKRTFTQ
jgi:hypothetical protein